MSGGGLGGKRRAARCPACLAGGPCPLRAPCPPPAGGAWLFSGAAGPPPANEVAYQGERPDTWTPTKMLAVPTGACGPLPYCAPPNGPVPQAAPGRLLVRTARIGYRGDDGLNVTRNSGGPYGSLFAPSWAILKPALEARIQAKSLTAGRGVSAEDRARARAILWAAWDAYVPRYRAEMRASYRAHRAAWDALLRRDRVTLLCWCADAATCHRTLLAAILGRCGAEVGGEVES